MTHENLGSRYLPPIFLKLKEKAADGETEVFSDRRWINQADESGVSSQFKLAVMLVWA